MCRIFGFRSILQSGVHKSLIDADNSIIHQSTRHPDGWGVAYYHMGSPHLIKLDSQAKRCRIFERVSGVVASNTVVAHIRKSTVGAVGALNTHPFQFGPWVFAHNGNVEGFKGLREKLLKKINPDLRSFILGETDSEYLFYLLLSIMEKRGLLVSMGSAKEFAAVLTEFVATFEEVAGPMVESKGDYDRNYLTFVLTNGRFMVAFNGGQSLYFSTHKSRCPERDTCAFHQPLCEKLAQSGDKIHHLLVSSEVIKNENVWGSIEFGGFVLIDENYIFHSGVVSRT